MSKICPYCGGELLIGYIQSRDGVCLQRMNCIFPMGTSEKRSRR